MKFLILFLLFFSSSVLAADRYYTTNSAAAAACVADKPAGYECARTGDPLGPSGKYVLKSQYVTLDTYFWNTGGCPVDQYEYPDGSCSVTPPPLSDAECAALAPAYFTHVAKTAGGALKINIGFEPTRVFNGCNYQTVPTTDSSYKSGKCTFGANDEILCSTLYQGVSSSTAADDSITEETPDDLINDTKQGGDPAVSTTNTPVTSTTDTPEPGDTTSTQTTTKQNAFTPETSVNNYDPVVEVIVVTRGGVTETTTSTTVLKADGSSVTTTQKDKVIDASYYQSDKWNKSTSTSSSTTGTADSGGTGQEITTTNKDAGGNVTSQNTTKSGNTSGSQNVGTKDLSGNCSPGEECTVKIDESGIDLKDNQSKIDKAEAGLKAEYDKAVSDLADDGDQDYGLSNVTNFSADYFISRYLTFPTGACSGSINTTIFGRPFIIEPCDKLQPLRDVLAWVFFILSFFACMKILLSTRSI